MNDELFALIDARGQSAGAALHRAAAVHPWTAEPPKRPVVWVRPALVLVAVVALLAGLVWVAHKPNPPAGHTPAGLRYVIGDLPAGWTTVSAQDASASLRNDSNGIVTSAYGTHDDPSEPSLNLLWHDPSMGNGVSLPPLDAIVNASSLRELSNGDRRAACGDYLPQVTQCALNLPDGPLWIYAHDVADEQLVQVIGAVQIVDAKPEVAAASIPAGMALLSSEVANGPAAAVWTTFGSVDSSRVFYSQGSSDGGVALAVGWSEDSDMASVWAGPAMHRVDVGGRTGYLGTADESQGGSAYELLVWRDGGRTFAIRAVGTSLDLVALAQSVRPAADTEWASITASTDGSQTIATDGTVPTGTAPNGSDVASLDTDVPVTEVSTAGGDVRDVAVQQSVESVTAVDAKYTCELPDGHVGTMQVAVVAGTVIVREPSLRSGSTSQVLGTSPAAGVITMDTSQGTAVVALSSDARATQLRVTRANGERYVLDLVPSVGHPELHVGVVVVPAGSLVSFDVVDAAGNVVPYSGQGE